MLNQTNPPTFKIVDPSASVASGVKVVAPKVIDPIFQLNRTLPDVSQLPPMPTVTPVVHSWMPDIASWLAHLLPSFHVGTWLAGLAPLLAGIGPTIAGIVAIQIARLTFGFVTSRASQPRPRADAEYARFSADSATIERLRQYGVNVIMAEDGTFTVPRYHIGIARRLGAKQL